MPYNPIPYSNEFAEFCRLRYGTEKHLVEDLPVFVRYQYGLRIAEVPMGIYYMESPKKSIVPATIRATNADIVRTTFLDSSAKNTIFMAAIATTPIAIQHKTRNQIKRAEGNGYLVRMMKDLEFYDFYINHHREQGFPTHSREYFMKLLKAFGEQLRCLGIFKDEKLVAFTLFVVNGSHLWLMQNASIRDPASPNSLAYSKMIDWGVNNGVTTFDFGGSRSDDDGGLHFKEGFGAILVPIDTTVWYRTTMARMRYWVGIKCHHLRIRFSHNG